MHPAAVTPDALSELIRLRAATHLSQGGRRFIAALAAPPAAGKSTLAAKLAAQTGGKVVPMDGFHYDDSVLLARGARNRKGAPDTFDAMGFIHLLGRLRSEDEVAIPLFDRALEISRAGADIITASDKILIVEGNYLLLNALPWPAARPHYDLTIWLDVPEAELIARLQTRWAHYGKSPEAAQAWIIGNDLPNIRRVIEGSGDADVKVLNEHDAKG
jgi:pantothenate kinase